MYEELAILTEFFKVKSWDRQNFDYQKPAPIDGHHCELLEFEGYDYVYVLKGFHKEIQFSVFKERLYVSSDTEKARLQELCNKIRSKLEIDQSIAV